MLRCKKCLYPETTRPFITFDEEGVCSGCRTAEEKEKINWKEREQILKKLVEKYKKSTSHHNCIVPVSGGKDSHFQVYYVTQILKMNPLLVTFNHLDNSETGLRNLENLIVKFKCDHIRFTPNPDAIKKSCRHAIKKMADPFWHEHAGIYSYPVQIACQFKIPLIIWGEYGFLDLVGMYSHNDFIEMSRKNRMEHGMRGMEVENFLQGNEEGLTDFDLEFCKYPSDDEIYRNGIRGIYLGNYLNWNYLKQTDLMIKKYRFNTQTQERTFNIYENVECYFNDTVHDFLKGIKYGYTRMTDHASQLIRFDLINRDTGAYFLNEKESFSPHYKFKDFCNWIEMKPDHVIEIAKSFKDPRTKIEPIEYSPSKVKHSVLDRIYIRNDYIHQKRRFFL